MYENLMNSIGFVSDYDPDVAAAMEKEHKRQQENIAKFDKIPLRVIYQIKTPYEELIESI